MSEGWLERARRFRDVTLTIAIASSAAGCSSVTSPDPVAESEPPAGSDVSQPYPIDRGDDAGTPGTYKGLWLRLVDNGEPTVTAVDGIIGLVCIGMSNANQECSDYSDRINSTFAADINPAVRVVNCAVGGNAIEKWNDPASDSRLWDHCITNKLSQAGVRPDQVRVIWHKAANQFTLASNGTAKPAYPDASSDYFAFYSNLSTFADRVRSIFPSIQAVYVTSRSYGGFANSVGRSEPLSYEEGHALNAWLAENRVVDGVWYGWGPYIWAPDCATGIDNGSGICFVRDDYVDDGVHPSPAGRAKVSNLLHARLLEHAWYPR